MTLAFFSGDGDAIVAAMEDLDFDRLDSPAAVSQRAEFALHLEPRDLDLLSQGVGSVTGREPTKLRPFLEVAVDTEEHGALKVAPAWVDYVASVPLVESDILAQHWADAMAAFYREPVPINDDMRRAVFDLISLCHRASETGANVVHVWWL